MSFTSPITTFAHGRGEPTPARLEEHLRATAKRFERLGIRRGDCVASLLPEGPDAATARVALGAFSPVDFVSLPALHSSEHYIARLAGMDAKMVLMHPSDHPVRLAARTLKIPIVSVFRHFEVGVFTLEPAVAPARVAAPIPAWKLNRGAPLVLVAPNIEYRQLSIRLDPDHPVIGITPPNIEHLPPPHNIEHIAAECVRMLRRYRPNGPYALAGWRAEAPVALEMARSLEEDGEKVAFVAMLDAPQSTPFLSFLRRQYQPIPWLGKIIHISPRLQWDAIAKILVGQLSQMPKQSAPSL